MATGDHVHDFHVADMSGQLVLWVTWRSIEGYWEVHRKTLKNDWVNMGRSFSHVGLCQCLKYYAEHGMKRVPWDEVKKEIPKWETVR